MEANLIDHFKELSDKHPDKDVRLAAKDCMEMCLTPKWKSRTMRKYLSNLSWALYEYIKTQKKK
jgi:hypothetical protein